MEINGDQCASVQALLFSWHRERLSFPMRDAMLHREPIRAVVLQNSSDLLPTAAGAMAGVRPWSAGD